MTPDASNEGLPETVEELTKRMEASIEDSRREGPLLSPRKERYAEGLERNVAEAKERMKDAMFCENDPFRLKENEYPTRADLQKTVETILERFDRRMDRLFEKDVIWKVVESVLERFDRRMDLLFEKMDEFSRYHCRRD